MGYVHKFIRLKMKGMTVL